MIVKNTTKSIIGLPVDHKGSVVLRVVPGWNEIPDEQWFTREVKLVDEQEIKGFGETVKHGAEHVAKGRMTAPEGTHPDLIVLGTAEQKDPKAPKRGKTLDDLDARKAVEIVKEVNDSSLLRKWEASADREVRIAILNQLDAIKPKVQE